MHKSIFLALFLLLIFLFGCHSERHEQKKYHKLTNSFKYYAYKSLSENSLPLIVVPINSQQHDSSKINIEIARLFLGFSWQLIHKYNYAVAEANIIISENKDPFSVFTAHTLLTSICYENGWKKLAMNEETMCSESKDIFEKNKQLSKYNFIYFLISAYRNIYKLDIQNTSSDLISLGKLTGITWPATLAEITFDISKNETRKAEEKLGKLMKDNTVPDKAKESIGTSLVMLLKEPTHIKNLQLLPSDLFVIILAQITNSKKLNLSNMALFLDEIKEKVSVLDKPKKKNSTDGKSK